MASSQTIDPGSPTDLGLDHVRLRGGDVDRDKLNGGLSEFLTYFLRIQPPTPLHVDHVSNDH
eukprot:7376607-Prymnesium_polylepis.1